MRSLHPLAVVFLLFIPATLQARLLVGTSGPTIHHVGDPAAATVPADDSLPPSYSVGFRHESLSLFWVDFWTWDGSYCLYGGRMRPRLISAEEAALLLDKKPREMTIPFAYRYPPGLFVFFPALLIASFLVVRRIRLCGSSRTQGRSSDTVVIPSSAMRR